MKVKGSETEGVWKLKSPNTVDGAKSTYWALQVTSPMSLEKFQTCFMDEDRRDRNCPIMALSFSKLNKLYHVRKQDFDLRNRWTKIKEQDVNDEFLGFFSLLISYARAVGRPYNYDLGPKQILPIMPRTDFVTMYKAFVQPKLEAQLKGGDCGLRDIVDSVAGEQVSEHKFKWPTGPDSDDESMKRDVQSPALSLPNSKLTKRAKSRLHVDNTWESKGTDVNVGELEVGTWLDELEDGNEVLAAMDEIVFDGQIGGLGNTMESISGSTKGYPIFEFRDIQAVAGDKLDKKFEEIDKYLKDLKPSSKKRKARAEQPSSPAGSQSNQSPQKQADSSDNGCQCSGKRRKNKCERKDKCPPGTVKLLAICKPCGKDEKSNDKGDKCEKVDEKDDCPKGQKRNVAIDKCEIECPNNEISNAAGDKCGKDCPPGQMKNVGGNKCEVDCPQGEISNVAGDKCGKDCPLGQNKNAAGDRCENNSKDKDCPPGQKKNAAGDKCEVDDKDKDRKPEDGPEKDKLKDEPPKDQSKPENDQMKEKKKTRNRVCLLFLATSVATELYNPDDVVAAADEWPEDVPWVEGELTESNIAPKVIKSMVGSVVSDDAGLPLAGLIRGGAQAGEEAAKGGAKAGSSGAKGASKGGNAAGNTAKTAGKGSDVSKNTISGFKSQKAYKSCLAMGPGAVTDSGATLKLGEEVPPGGFVADDHDQLITVKLCDGEDCGNNYHSGDQDLTWQSYPDAMWRDHRIDPGKCVGVSPLMENKVSAYTVTGGCCVFYDGAHCEAETSLFSANDREDQNLKKPAQDAIESFICNHNVCRDLPAKPPPK